MIEIRDETKNVEGAVDPGIEVLDVRNPGVVQWIEFVLDDLEVEIGNS